MKTPKRRSPPELKDADVSRADSFLNVLTGLNVAGGDKRRSASFLGKRITEFEAEELWRGDHIIERGIETVPLMEMRNGFEVVVTDDDPAEKSDKPPPKDDTDQDGSRIDFATTKAKKPKKPKASEEDPRSVAKRDMQKKLEGLQVVQTFIRARQWARAFGGAAIWIGADENGKQWKDVERLKKPLDPNKLKDIRHLTCLRPHECWPIRWYKNPMEPNYGTPSHFYVMRDSQGGAGSAAPLIVHESRLIRFFGAVTSPRQMATNNGWGDSYLVRVIEVVADFQASMQAAAHLVLDFAQAVQKVAGLAELIASGDIKTVEERARMIAMARSVARTVLIDTEEEYTREQTPLSGLPDLLDRLAKNTAAAWHMPVTFLFGESPAGLNATGETDVRWFYDEIANQRTLQVKPPLELLIRLLFCCTEGPTAGEEPSSWKVIFNPLWQPTQKEIAERNKIQADADKAYVDMQAVTPEEIADSRFGSDEWSPETKLDRDTRERMKAAHEEAMNAAEAEGKVPMPSPAKAADQQNAVDLAKAQPDPAPGEEKKPPKKAA